MTTEYMGTKSRIRKNTSSNDLTQEHNVQATFLPNALTVDWTFKLDAYNNTSYICFIDDLWQSQFNGRVTTQVCLLVGEKLGSFISIFSNMLVSVPFTASILLWTQKTVPLLNTKIHIHVIMRD